MTYQVGDQVFHWNYGIGKIVRLDEKVLSGQKSRYYVVRIRDLTIWVPIDDLGESSLRLPTPKSDFEALFKLLISPAEPLPIDRLERKTLLSEYLKDGRPEGFCRVIRDLWFLRHTKKLNDYDKAILDRAEALLFSEWANSWSVSTTQAEQELSRLMGGKNMAK